jgi:hypothetical protein
MVARLARGQQVLDSEEFPLADYGKDALVSVGSGQPGELVPGLQGDPDTGSSAEVDEALEALVAALAGDANVVELARAGANGLLDRVEAVKNFHASSLLSKSTNSLEALECLEAD